MGTVFAVFATIGFVLGVTQGLFALSRWLKEPCFQVYGGTIETEGTGAARRVKTGELIILAQGGARARKVINWLVAIGAPGKGMGSVGNKFESINEVIAPHDVTTFPLQLQGGTGIGESENLEGVVLLDLGNYQERVPFSVIVSGSGTALVEDAVHRRFHRAFFRDSNPLWKRIWSQVARRLS